MTLRQFATLAGISNPYLSQIERGLRAPSQQVVDAIAKALETSADALYQEAGEIAAASTEDGRTRLRATLSADPALSARQQRVLLDVYDAMIAAGNDLDRPPSTRGE